MNKQEQQCHDLQTLWHADFPLSKAMDMRVTHYADHKLTTTTPLSPNTNTHGTAFAGSLYALEALTAWGLLYLELASAGLDASIIHADGKIEFAKPVTADIVATASLPDAESIIRKLTDSGKVKLTISTEVFANGELASKFSGTYLART